MNSNTTYMKCSRYSLLSLFFSAIFILISASAFASNPGSSGYVFQLTIETGDEIVTLSGESDLTMTPSSYTIVMNMEGEGRCVLHMLNFSVAPGPGTYEVEDTSNVRTAMLCLIESREPQERKASYSGTFTITEVHRNFIKGDFDMMLRGPISGNEFRVRGAVTSENLPSEIRSRNNPFIRN